MDGLDIFLFIGLRVLPRIFPLTSRSVERGVGDTSPFWGSLGTHESFLVSTILVRNCKWNYGEKRHLSRIMRCIRLSTSSKVISTLIIINRFMWRNKFSNKHFLVFDVPTWNFYTWALNWLMHLRIKFITWVEIISRT